MAEIVTIGPVAASYCANCQEPKNVGALQIKDWKFAPPVCGECLQKLAQRLEARAEQSVEPEGAKKK